MKRWMTMQRMATWIGMVVAGLVLAPGLRAAAADEAADEAAHRFERLDEPAAALEFRYGKKRTSGARVDQDLSPAVRATLNDYADVASELDLTVVVCEEADVVLMGGCDEDWLREAVDWIEDAWELIEGVRPAADAPPRRAALALLFDEQGFADPSWAALLGMLAERDDIDPISRASLTTDPRGIDRKSVV